jgi:diacylglycerol O-acyltransferase / wax synthase
MAIAESPSHSARAVSSPVGEPGREARLSPVDLAWLRMDDPTNLMMISGVLVFDGPLSRDQLAAALEERLLVVPRFRQKVVGSLLARRSMAWQDDADFDLANHLEEHELPDPGDDQALQLLVCELMSRPLDPGRPLWCFHLIHNYQGGSAVMGRLHHCIADGIALMLVLLSLTDRGPEPGAAGEGAGGTGEPRLNPFTELFTRGRHAIETVRAHAEELMPEGMKLLLRPVEALRSTNRFLAAAASVNAFGRLALRPPDPKSLFRGPLGVAKRAAWSGAIPLEEVRRLAAARGGNLNDLLLTAATGGLRRYLVGRGQDPRGLNLRAVVPVNLRPLERMAELGNQFGLIFLSLPVGIADPGERFEELRRRMRALKQSAEPVVAFAVLKSLGIIPRFLQKAVVRLFATKATLVVTSVPGPCEPLYLAGRRLSSIFFWVPQAGRVGLGVSILSYAGEVRLGVGTDAGLVPDPAAIVGGFYEELEALDRLGA